MATINCLVTFFGISHLMFYRQKKLIQVWKNLSVSKWWQNLHFQTLLWNHSTNNIRLHFYVHSCPLIRRTFHKDVCPCMSVRVYCVLIICCSLMTLHPEITQVIFKVAERRESDHNESETRPWSCDLQRAWVRRVVVCCVFALQGPYGAAFG